MMKPLFIIFILIIAAAGCTYETDLPLEYPTPPPDPSASPVEPLKLVRDAELEATLATLAAAVKAKTGVAAIMLDNGAAAKVNADARFPMQSVYKLPIAMTVAEKVRLGEMDLDEKIGVTREDMVRAGMRSPLRDEHPNGGEFTIRGLIRLSIVESDGTASDVLMRIAGGAAEIQGFLDRIGISEMKVANTEKELGRDWNTQYENWSTPVGAADLLRWLDISLKNEDEGLKLIERAMIESVPGEKRIKGLLPRGTVVMHKTGTSGTRDGVTSATNDIGTIHFPDGRRAAVAIFISDSSLDEAAREAAIARFSKAIWDRWSAVRQN